MGLVNENIKMISTKKPPHQYILWLVQLYLLKSKEEIFKSKVLNDSNTRHQVKDIVDDYVDDA